MNINSICLGSCSPPQVVNLNVPINDMTVIGVLDENGCEYDRDKLEYSYSVDNVIWACFGTYQETSITTLGLNSDFYLKIKVPGGVSGVIQVNEETKDCEKLKYTTQIAEGFKFDYQAWADSANAYNPYANMEAALELQEQLNELVSEMLGIQVYYFKLSPNVGSKDLTFKEYALMDVEAVKLIKIMVNDGEMPSSKPDFSDFGLEWANDWPIQITKGTFATAFGNKAMPMEGDLIYIPMMKRMWMVSSAYEEKNGALMWNATYFTVNLVKYQEKDSVDLGDTEDMVNSFVKNKYEDLFGDQENLDSGETAVNAPINASENMYPIYESDAMRKWITVGNIDIITYSMYYKGTLIADNHYKFNNPNLSAKIIYQRKYCGTDGSLSFIIYPTTIDDYSGTLLEISTLKLNIIQQGKRVRIYVANNPEMSVDLLIGEYYFVWLRWSTELNLCEIGAAKYSYPENMPLYAVQNQHFYFNMDNLVARKQSKYNMEMVVEKEGDITLYQFYGTITNIKMFDIYNDNLSELLQQYPTNQHLIVNDTVRKLLDRHGPGLK